MFETAKGTHTHTLSLFKCGTGLTGESNDRSCLDRLTAFAFVCYLVCDVLLVAQKEVADPVKCVDLDGDPPRGLSRLRRAVSV